MKMISTYISLLLFCGFMLLFYYCSTHSAKSPVTDPGGKKTRVVIKRNVPPASMAVHFLKDHLSDKTEFSFFRDVVINILPVLRNLN